MKYNTFFWGVAGGLLFKLILNELKPGTNSGILGQFKKVQMEVYIENRWMDGINKTFNKLSIDLERKE